MNANVGMAYPVASKVNAYTVGTSITYQTGNRLAEAVSANITWNREDGHFYGDNVELDSDNSITGYSIDFEPSGFTDAIRAGLLGEASVGSSSAAYYDVEDGAAPDHGFGYIRVMRSKAVGSAGAASTTYDAWWFYKGKFAVSSEETRTKEQSMEWRVPTLTFTGCGVSLDGTGKLKFAAHKQFTTLADAKTWLNNSSRGNIT